MKSIVLYGIGGADTQYVAIQYQIFPDYTSRPIVASNKRIRWCASVMIAHNPTIEHVYAIKNRPGLANDYRKSVFDRHNSIEARIAFRDMLETEGVLII